jgi:hypothetical protein
VTYFTKNIKTNYTAFVKMRKEKLILIVFRKEPRFTGLHVM